MLFLGVDGGGTKTVAAVADAGGRILGTGLGGPVNIGWVGAEVATRSTVAAVESALAAAGASPTEIACAYLGMAGVDSDRPDDEAGQVFLAALQGLGMAADTAGVDNDAYVGLAAATGPGPGVAVVAGTGFTAVGIAPDGRRVRVPWYVGARGAGHILGRQAALAALFELAGAGKPTAMTRHVMAVLGLETAHDLERWLAVPRPSWELGRLTPAVSAAAEEGDAMAADMLQTAGMEFGLAAVFVARATGLDRSTAPCPIATVGGVFRAGARVTGPMAAVLEGSGINATLVPPSMPPVGGAVILAWNRAGIDPGPGAVRRLAADLSAL